MSTEIVKSIMIRIMNLRVWMYEQSIHWGINYTSQLILISTKTYPVNLNKQRRHMSNMKHDTRNIYNSGHFAHEQWNDYHRISHFVRDTDTNKLKKFLLNLSIFISATSIYHWQIFKRIMFNLIFESAMNISYEKCFVEIWSSFQLQF